MTTSITYIADGERTIFEFPFRIFATGEVKVSLDDRPTDGFSVSGRSVVFAAAPENGARVSIRRELDFLRESRFKTGGVFRAEDLNEEIAYTRACMEQVNGLLSEAMGKIKDTIDNEAITFSRQRIEEIGAAVEAALSKFANLDEKVAFASDCADAAEKAFDEITELFGTTNDLDFGILSP